jgi:SAM-dependent methyltransferase
MDINVDVFNKLILLINSAKKNINYELEARLWAKNKLIIDEEKFNRLFKKFTFSKDFNGYGYSYETKNILDIILDKSSINNGYESIRMSINGKDDIKKYWLTNNIDGLNISFIEKENIDKLDYDDFDLRFNLKNEIPEKNILKKNINLFLSKNNDKIDKLYRFKNRYSIKTDDNLFQIDMSYIKTGYGKTFKDSNTLKEKISYEIEIEYINKDLNIDSETIANSLLIHCLNILKIIRNTNILLSNEIINTIKDNYKKLANLKYDDIFIAASPVTLHKENLFKNDEIVNIYENYAVTLKADGERNFLFVNNDGKIYIFNNNFNIIDTGYIDDEWKDTLIEGELIKETNDLYMYDILFSKGIDVRKKILIDIKKEDTRVQFIDNFLKSTTRKIIENFPKNEIINLYSKKYIQTIRADGSDIFQKTKELWDTQKISNFNVDGIIFTPKYKHYPNKGISWSNLFKWKPPNLNSIDFLIRTIKDDNKNDVKSPFIDVIIRPDGKKETILKQYKTFELFVSGEKKVFKKNSNYNVKRIPILFNPFNTDAKNSEIYNLAKIMINDDGKVYAIDPITNDKIEIYDDIIVEFSYDITKEEGFRWIPIRFRKDKTNLYKNGKEVFGNSERTANDIFRAINNPITEEMITTGNISIIEEKDTINTKQYYQRSDNKERFPYQNFHNLYIKYQLLYLSSPNYINEYQQGTHGKILDLCCGRGVDINKIKRAKYAEVVGIDIDYKNIKDAQEFYKSVVPSPKPKAYYIRGDSSKLIFPNQMAGITDYDKQSLKKYIPTKYIFDTISLQFCFHYFFKDEISLLTILQNINDNLKIGGYVIGTTFDGQRLYEKLGNNDYIMGKTFSGETMWKIEKKYTTKLTFTEKKPNYGKLIDVFVKTIGVNHEEYLVNFKFLDKIMEEYGFSKVFVKPFEEFYQELVEKKNILNLTTKEMDQYTDIINKMSDEEKNFSFLSSGFIYKKEKNSSDALYKKLMNLIEKKDKVSKKITKMDENVYKMNEQTQELYLND